MLFLRHDFFLQKKSRPDKGRGVLILHQETAGPVDYLIGAAGLFAEGLHPLGARHPLSKSKEA
jgi:hypothetical protein